jgi:hypothetical protein
MGTLRRNQLLAAAVTLIFVLAFVEQYRNLCSSTSAIDEPSSPSLLTENRVRIAIENGAPLTSGHASLTPAPKHDRGDGYDTDYYKLPPEAKLAHLETQMRQFINQSITCETKYIRTSLWCDSNPGNGMKSFLKALALGFILNRLPLVSVHRKDSCEGVYLDFKNPELFLTKESSLESFLHARGCPAKVSSFSIGAGNTFYACKSIGERLEQFFEMEGSMGEDVSSIADIQFNPSLNEAQLQRARRVFDVGLYTTVGMISDLLLDISTKVKIKFQGEYRPEEAVMQQLSDSAVLKVGIHVRHLPFVVRDEGGPQNIDKRALKCLDKAMVAAMAANSQKYSKGCLVLVATDMMSSRDRFAKDVAGLTNRCSTLVLRRTSNASDEWGGSSYSDWEHRDPKRDKRGMLEAFLDYFVLSEYSDFFVFSSGSTFSQLIGFRNARRSQVTQNVEFSCSSCKEDYLPYACCFTRKRWDEGLLVTRYSSSRCASDISS